MFGYYNNVRDLKWAKLVDITTLHRTIRNHPMKDRVELLHTYEKGSDQYTSLKMELPVVSAAAICGDSKDEADIVQMSGYLFFDIDAVEDLGETMANLLTEHQDKISLLSMSVGGRGVSFYVRCENLTKENYRTVYQNVSALFSNYQLDKKCKNPTRLHFIPFDENVYLNTEVSINANDFITGSEVLSSSAYMYSKGIALNDKKYPEDAQFIASGELLPRVKWNSYTYEGPGDFEIKPIEFCKVVWPFARISDGNKRPTFTRLLTTLMYCNPDFGYNEAISFISLINETRTDVKMKFGELVKLTRSVLSGLKKGTTKVPTKIKRVHISRHFTGNKRELANRVNAAVRTSITRNKIKKTIELLEAEGEMPTVKNIVRYSGLGQATVYRNINQEPLFDVHDEEFMDIVSELEEPQDDMDQFTQKIATLVAA